MLKIPYNFNVTRRQVRETMSGYEQIDRYHATTWLYDSGYYSENKDEDGDNIRTEYCVCDARRGYIVFKNDSREGLEFVKWFRKSSEAIEFATELVRAGRLLNKEANKE